MKKGLLLRNVLVTFCALLLFAILSFVVLASLNSTQYEKQIVNMTEIYKKQFKYGHDYSELVKLEGNLIGEIRITIIDKNGTVKADSNVDVSQFPPEDHLDRQEIINALNDNPSPVVRNSATKGYDMLYYAVKIVNPDDATDYIFLRLSSKASDINTYLWFAIPILFIIMVIVFAVSILLTVKLNQLVVGGITAVKEGLKAVNHGNYEKIVPNFAYDELNAVFNEMNEIQGVISENISQLTSQKNKLDLVLENINQGVMAFDKNLNLLFINGSAKSIFNLNKEAKIKNKNFVFYVRDNEIREKIKNAVDSKKNDVVEIKLGEKVYSMNINISEINEETICLLVFVDITLIVKNEKLRSQFFAHASHELKTPITSIMGFCELIQNGMSGNKTQEFIDRIVKDSKRMMVLIDDMLRLSKLDAKVECEEREKIELKKLINEVVSNESLNIQNKKISVNVCGEATVFAENNAMFELLSNLVSNAVRYNKVEGKVDIKLEENDMQAIISVSDTGIGIPNSCLDRIFERFYRVDKGRSKEVGGTGLGLSIVKHIVENAKGKISIQSKEGQGTTIKVILPKI